MNHLYRSLWNDVTRTFVAVAEVARGRGKRSSDSRTAGTGDAAVAPPTSLLRPMALEPRLMFDAAAVAATVDVVHADGGTLADGGHGAALAEAAQRLVQAAPAAVYAPAERREVVFVENNVSDLATLLAGIPDGREVVVLDSLQDGLAQMASYLQGRSGIDALHVVSHGSEAALGLGTLTFTSANMADHAGDLATLRGALSEHADVLLYGCDVGAGADGAAFVAALAQAVQADVAASTNLTGAVDKGGDWQLERASGAIEATALSVGAYRQILPSVAGTISPTEANNGFDYGVVFIDGEGGSTDIAGVEYGFYFVDGSNILVNTVAVFTSTFTGTSYTGLVNSAFDSSADGAVFRTTGGENFKLTSFFIQDSDQLNATWTVTAYDNGNPVGTPQNFTIAQGGEYARTVSLSTDFQNIDEVRITLAGGISGGHLYGTLFSSLVVADPVLPNVAPVATTSGGTTAFTEGNNVTSTPVVVDSGITLSDSNNATLASGTVSITGGFQSSQDTLAFTNNPATMGNVSASYNAGTGVLSLTSAGATATLAQWQAALRSVTYTDSSDSPNTGNRTVSFVVNDGTANSSAGTKTVSVSAVNDTPIATASGGTTAFTEGNNVTSTPVTVDSGLTLSDLDSSTLASATVSITGNLQTAEDSLSFSNNPATMGNVSASYNAGTGVMTLTSAGATATLAQWQAALRSVTYTDSSDTPNTSNRTISFVVSDGSSNSTTTTKTVSVNSTNDTPVIGNLSGDSVAWAGVGGTVVLDAGANTTATDVEFAALNGGNGNWAGASLTVQRSGSAVTSDVFGFSTSGALFTVLGANLQSGGQTFATYTLTGGVLSISFTSGQTPATTALVQDVQRHISYRNDTPAGDAIVRFTLNDGTSGATADVTVTSDTIYVNNTTDTATIDASDGVSFSEAVAIAAADATGSQTLVFTSAFTGTQTLAGNLAINESLSVDATASGGGFTLSGSTITLGSGTTLTWQNTTNRIDTFSSTLAGSGGLVKAGAGKLTLDSTGNSAGWSGPMSVTAGVLSATSDSRLSSGTLTLDGGTLDSSNSTFEIDNAIVLGSGGGTFNVTGVTRTLTLSGVVSGSGALNKVNGGTLALTAANAYSGGTIISGTSGLTINDASNLGSGAITLNTRLTVLNAATIANSILLNTSDSTVVNANALTLSGTLSGDSVSKLGDGRLTLAGTNYYTGSTTVSAGSLQLASDRNLGAGALTLDNAELHFSATATIYNAITLNNDATIFVDGVEATLSGVISGSGTLNKAGNSLLELTGTNDRTGATHLQAGSIRIAGDANLGTGTAAVSLESGTALGITGTGTIDNDVVFNGSAAIETSGVVTLSGALSGGAHELLKYGAGTLALTNTANEAGLTGGVRVYDGVLAVGADDALVGGTVSLNGGSLSLTGTPTIDNDIDLVRDGTITAQTGVTATFSGVVSNNSSLTLDGPGTVVLAGTNTYTGTTTVTAGTLSVASDANLGSDTLTLAGGQLAITGATDIDNAIVFGAAATVTTSADATLSGTLSGSGELAKAGSSQLTLSGTNNAGSGTTVQAGTLAISADSQLASGTLTLAGGTLAITGVTTIDNAIAVSSASTVSASADATLSGVISGSGNLSKAGASTLTLTASNTHSGAVNVTAGGLSLIGGASIGNSSAVTVSTGATLTLAGGAETIGSLAGAGNVVLGAYRLTTGGANTNTSFSGVISGTGSGITKAGSGTFTLSGANTYTGSTTVSAGTLLLGNGAAIADTSAVTVAAGATLRLQSADETIASLAGAGTVTLNGGSLTLAGDASTTFSGVIQDGGAGSRNLIKLGSGTLTLSGNNTYSGTTRVAGGILSVGGDGNLGSGTLTLDGGHLAITGTTTIDNAVALLNTAFVTVASGTATLSGAISGTAALAKDGAGTLVLTSAGNAASHSGTTEVRNGTLAVAGDANLGAGTITLNGGTLSLTGAGTVDNAITLGVNGGTVDTAVAVTLSGALGGSGLLVVQGGLDGMLTLTHSGNASSFSGDTLVVYSMLRVASDANLGSGTVTLNGGWLTLTAGTVIDNALVLGQNGGTVVAQADSSTLSGAISGNGGLHSMGSMTLRLSGVSSYTGYTWVEAGVLEVTGALDGTAGVFVGPGVLAGTGSIGTNGVNGEVVVQSNGTVAPGLGAGGIGTLTLRNGLRMNGGQLLADVRGTSAGSGHDQVVVQGSVTVSNATPTLDFGNYTATAGESYQLISNDGSDAVGDPFGGQGEGSTLTAIGRPFRVSYVGGDGNDVTLTALNGAPTLANALTAQSATQNSAFGFTVPANSFADIDLGDTLSYTATLANGSALPSWLSFNAATRAFSGTPLNGDVGAITVRVTATDAGSASASGDFTLTVGNTNDAPTSNGIAAQSATEDAAFSFTVPANAFTDVDAGDTLSYAATLADGSALPAWLNFNPATRAFTGTPANGDVGAITLKVTATDASNASASSDFALTVANTNDAPTPAAIAAQAAIEDSGFSFTVPANTFADVDVGDMLSYAATQSSGAALPGWLSFDATTRTFSGTPLNGDVGAITVKVTATDSGSAGASSNFTLTVANTNDAPTTTGIAAQDAVEDSAFSFTLPSNAFTDVDASDALRYAATLPDGSALPSWLSFNAAARTFSGTPANGDVGTISVKVTATDGSNADVSSSFTLTVANTNDAPTAAGIAAQSATEDSAFAFTVPANTFADMDLGDTLAYAARLADGSALPGWLSFDAATRSFSGTPPNGDVGVVTVKVTATDGSGASVSSNFALTVTNINDAPTVAGIAAQSATEDTAFSFTVAANTFADVDVGDTLSYSATLADGAALPGWLSFNAATQTFSGMPVNGDVGAIAVKVTATDGSNASGSSNFTLTVANTNDVPTSTAIAAQSASQDSAFSFTVAANTFADVDVGDTLAYAATRLDGSALPGWLSFDATTRTFSGTPLNGDVGAIAVKVIATDSGNASASSNFTLTVANTNDAPTGSAIAAQAASEDSAFAFTVPADSFTDVDVADTLTYAATLANGSALPAWLSFNAATRSFSGTPANGDVGVMTLRVTATDASNASASSNFTLTVANTNDAPTAAGIAAQTATEPSRFSFTVPAGAFTDVDAGDTLRFTATLANGAALPAWLGFDVATRTFSGTPAFADIGAITVRVTATDGSGANAASDFTLTVAAGPEAPLLPVPPAPVPAPPPAPVSPPLPVVVDITPSSPGFFTASPAGVVLGGLQQPVTAAESPMAPPITRVADAPISNSGRAADTLQVLPQLGTVSLGGGANRTVDVPLSAFVVSSDGPVVVQARLADGQPLPSWLRFDPATGKLVGRVPAAARGVIQVVLTVRDSQGNAASTQVEIRLDDAGAPADAPAPADASEPVLPVRPQSLQRTGDATERLAARPALSEQLRHARLQQRGTVADRLAATPRGERATTRQG